jgi:signal transduction histidine kinase
MIEEGAILSITAVQRTGTQPALERPADLRDVVCQLVHEVRQPLGGIESLAYYLELALEGGDEELREQCGRLRQLVTQAGWMLEDAALAAAAPARAGARADFNAIAGEVGERLARHEERPLRLALESGAAAVHGSAAAVRRWLVHALSFLRDLAQGEPMPLVETMCDGQGVWLRVHSRVGCEECLRSLDPPGGVGGLRRMAEAGGGRYEFRYEDHAVTVGLWLPVVDDALDEMGIPGA